MFELICRPEDEAQMRALMLQAMSQSPLVLTGVGSEDLEGTADLRVAAQIRGAGRQNEAGVSSVTWALRAGGLEQEERLPRQG